MPPDPDNTPPDAQEERDAERGRLLVLAAARDVSAPLALRERIEADRQRAAAGRPRRRWTFLAPLAGVAAAAAAVLVVVAGGGPSAPNVLAVASLAGRTPVLAAPAPDPHNPAVLRESVDGVPFPQWDRSFKWRPVGRRYDTVGERKTTTVFYKSAKGTVAAYTIVGGGKIDRPSNAKRHVYGGTTLWTVRRDGRLIVSWQRRGHTCVMSAPAKVPEEKLLSLAAWKGDEDHIIF
jgi:hypothetical protein